MDVRTPIPTNGGDWLKRFGGLWSSQTEQVRAKFGADLEEVLMPGAAATDMLTLVVKKARIVELLSFLRDACEYGFLSDVTATDELEYDAVTRFRVVYHLFSQTKHCRIRVKVRVADQDTVPTAVKVWPGANWAEREVFDMFGIRFEGHPDLRRILMDERWEGHPLRKDYPLRGYQIFTEPMKPRPELLE